MDSSNKTAEAVLIVSKKLIKWAIFFLVGLATFVIITVYSYDEYRSWKARPIAIKGVNGISLGDKQIDVVFKNSNLIKEATKDGQRNNRVNYSNDELYVGFENGHVNDISVICGDKISGYPSLNAITCNSSSEDVLKKYANDAIVLCSSNGLARVYQLQKYKIAYILEKNKVVIMQISNSLQYQKGDAWKDCNEVNLNN